MTDRIQADHPAQIQRLQLRPGERGARSCRFPWYLRQRHNSPAWTHGFPPRHDKGGPFPGLKNRRAAPKVAPVSLPSAGMVLSGVLAIVRLQYFLPSHGFAFLHLFCASVWAGSRWLRNAACLPLSLALWTIRHAGDTGHCRTGIPTHVGMNRSQSRVVCSTAGIPHACGDGAYRPSQAYKKARHGNSIPGVPCGRGAVSLSGRGGDVFAD